VTEAPDNGDTPVSRNLPVLASEASPAMPEAEARPIDRPAEGALPAPLLAATGGFLAGVATFVLFRVLRRGRGSKRLVRVRRRDRGVEIAGSRSFLVDVHVLKR
jgi:hypothetical protein